MLTDPLLQYICKLFLLKYVKYILCLILFFNGGLKEISNVRMWIFGFKTH